MLVSSTEPPAFHTLGERSTIPEKYGVDFLWFKAGGGQRGWCGVQRKEVKDLVASIADKRLAREVKQMRPLVHAMLVVEGRWDVVGDVVTVGRTQARVALWDAVLWQVQQEGVKVSWSANTVDTMKLVARFQQWTMKARHTALADTRGGVKVNSWGKHTDEDFAVHLLCGLPGVGEKTARAVVTKFGGVPWAWTVTEDELCQVDGIGPTTARRMMGALNGNK